MPISAYRPVKIDIDTESSVSYFHNFLPQFLSGGLRDIPCNGPEVVKSGELGMIEHIGKKRATLLASDAEDNE